MCINMIRTVLLLYSLASSFVLANGVDTNELYTPTIELVTTIHEFCLEQHTAQNEADFESTTLKCVNADLEISTYKTFKTYAELNSFISQEKGER